VTLQEELLCFSGGVVVVAVELADVVAGVVVVWVLLVVCVLVAVWVLLAVCVLVAVWVLLVVCVPVAVWVAPGGGKNAQLLGTTAAPPSKVSLLLGVRIRLLNVAAGTTGAFASKVLQSTSAQADVLPSWQTLV